MKKSVHCFIDKARKAGSFETSRQGTNFGWRLTPEEAARLMREHGYDLPFDIMCKEYGDDDDWVGMSPEDLNEAGEDRAGLFDEDYKTLEVYADVSETDSVQSITRDMGR
ncbi:MAG: hypothetical protein Q7R35_14255 [Elusimicrobiota bacterium]|nr:hypothetical protein [Elusimicrobiota bacterium]